MSNQALLDLIEYLEATNAKVRQIEAEGERVLQSQGQVEFQVKLEAKAKVLARLADDSWELVDKIDGRLGDEITQRLEQFSMSASTALRIGSVFFMTALLYPEDHEPGGPNDLETYIEELRKLA